MKILSIKSIKKSDAYNDIWGAVNNDNNKMTCSLYKSTMGLQFQLEITDSEYVYLIDNNHNPVLYSKRLSQHFDRALAEYIKKNCLKED
jgi:hypothetical protein